MRKRKIQPSKYTKFPNIDLGATDYHRAIDTGSLLSHHQLMITSSLCVAPQSFAQSLSD